MAHSNNVTVTVPIINYRLQIAERLGADKHAVLAKAGVAPKLLANAQARISVDQERALWRAMVAETGREDIGIVCGLNFPIQATGLIGYVMMNSPTIAVAIKKICTYQKMIGDSMGMRVEEEGDYFTVFVDLWSVWYEELRYTMDIMVTACLSWVEKNTVIPVRPIRVGIVYQQPDNYMDYQEVFSPAPVEFGVNTSYVMYNRKDMETALLSQDPGMFALFDKQVEELFHEFEGTHTITQKTRKLILEHMKAEVPGIESIAEKLFMSVRSLQKALKAEQTSYQRLLNDVRKELAIEYLKKGILNKSEIAFLLGFSELSVFSRNFKKWTGYAPSEFPLRNS